MTETKSIQDFIREHGLSMRAEWTDHNPHMDDSEQMDHWKCRIRKKGGGSMSVIFSMGIGHKGRKPELAEVLDCLASDAAGFHNATGFDDWCSEYGYDTDSRKAYRTFKVIERQAEKLESLLGEDACKQLLWETERQ